MQHYQIILTGHPFGASSRKPQECINGEVFRIVVPLHEAATATEDPSKVSC